MALTTTVWLPSASGPAIDHGLVHAAAVAPSNAQVYDVTSAALSENTIEAVVALLGLDGPTTTGTAGAVWSTTQLTVRVAPLPSASRAVTASECVVSARPLAVNGLVHAAAVAPSRLQVKPAVVASASENVMLTAVELVGVAGWLTVGTAGRVTSTVHDVRTQLLGAFPLACARTEHWWLPPAMPV